MKCRQCDHDNPASGRFCSACGSRLDVACPQCQQPNQPDATFCNWCGSMLPHARTARGGEVERKQATILFVDIVNSTRMVAGLDAEGVMLRLRPVMAVLSETARRFNGTVLRSLGDGLKIAFGAPRALEGHAILACQAALAMQKAMRAVPHAPDVRIGLHSGEVVAGDIDTGVAVETAAQGLTVHIASRIEQLADAGGICISDSCFQLVRAFCDTVPIGEQTLRGVAGSMAIHRLIGLRPAISSEQFRATDLTPLRSRDAALDSLDLALAEAMRGTPPVAGISAGAGIGKSRLCFEFGERCRRQGVYVLEARCFLHGQAMPMVPIIEMFRTYFRILPRYTPDDVRRAIRDRLALLDASLLPEAWLLHGLLGVRADSDPPMPGDPRDAQLQLHALIARIVKAAGREPGVLICDDVHWIDPVSLGLLTTIIEAAEGTHLLIVLNFRPPFRAPWMAPPRYRELSLDELGPADSEALASDLIGPAEALGPLRVQVASRCAGNPFFAEELVRSLVDTGVLAGHVGSYDPGPTPLAVALPTTVEAVIGARLDRLPDHAKALLQTGAIIGKEFPVALLRSVTSLAEDTLESHLAQLRDAGLIIERPTAVGRSYAFRHPLIQEVAYGSQLRTRRRDMHANVARAIEQLPWGKLDEFAGLVAHHCEEAGEPLAAAKHLQRSAYWIGRTDSAQALRQWKAVRALLDDVPVSQENNRLRAQACAQVLNFGWREGITPAEVKPYAEEAVNYAREVNDTVHGPLLLSSYGRILAARGAADEYVALSREALSMRANDIDVMRDAMLHGTHAQALWLSGRPRDALRIVETALGFMVSSESRTDREDAGFDFRRLIGFDPGHWLHAQQARLLVWLGRFAEAEAAIDDLERMEASVGEVAVVKFIPHLAAAEMGFWTANAKLAKRHADLLADYSDRVRLPYLRVAALFADGLASSARSDFTRAASSLREALSFARSSNAGLEFEPLMQSVHAEATYRKGAAVEAAALARDAIAVSQQRTNRIAECHASLTWAAAMLEAGAGGSVARTEPLLARAEELIEESGAVILEPLLRQVLSSRDRLS